MLTTAVFAFMMFNVDKIIGATHYTLFASIEVIENLPALLFQVLWRSVSVILPAL